MSLALDEQTLSKLYQANDEESILSIFQDMHKRQHSNITNDDVVDLKIALHKCKTFDDVMSIVCQK
jgi:hypothetical protein